MTDKYSAGTGIALLNGDAEISYDNFVLIESEGSMDEFVFREDWKGADTYQKNARFSSPFTPVFQNSFRRHELQIGAQNAARRNRAGRRNLRGRQSYGTWKTVKGNNTATCFSDSPTFPRREHSVRFAWSRGTETCVSASYLWLICEKDGRDYIADCVYFPYEYDALLHGVTEIPASMPRIRGSWRRAMR